jgi:2-polyprenyl-3-methyl-5-hydroxy-6-metoxy-1,4-benzoquinol methylase
MKVAADIYQFDVDPNSDTAAANVLRFVGKGRKVLEIGAGPGAISRRLVELNGCKVSAIEIDKKSVEILRSFCEKVWRSDLNDPAWAKQVSAETYDNVVIADVLEHLIDPWTTLRLAGTLVNEQGSVVVSIPHASHSAILSCLLTDNFEYRDWGLLDRTHIRFFSMKNIQALFESANLAIVDYVFVLKHPSETEFAEAWASLPSRTKTLLESSGFGNVYQVVVKAVPANKLGARPALSLLDRPSQSLNKLKYIAFYLPQFHPIPENDTWWGKGFTEWTNVTQAKPLFPGHYQPHLPADLGFYDLRLREVQHQQIALAHSHGIDAFCFHYYWFGGRRLLERPLLDFLNDKRADIDFCLCWANENWTRKWDASEHEILMEQIYTPENDLAFLESVLPFFKDRRYLRVNGAPVLIVYRPQHMPDARGTALAWRQHCRDAGIGEIHLVAALTHGNRDFEQFGFDAGVEFSPHNAGVGNVHPRNLAADVDAPVPLQGAVWDYSEVAQSYIQRDYSDRRIYRCVFPSWDNTARVHSRALIIHGATPEKYERWLESVSYQTAADRLPGERLVFINAWNEWAEGCHLEPDRENNMAFLKATARVKSGRSKVDLDWENEAKDKSWEKAPEDKTVLVSPPPRTVVFAAKMLLEHPKAYRAAQTMYRALLKKPRS